METGTLTPTTSGMVSAFVRVVAAIAVATAIFAAAVVALTIRQHHRADRALREERTTELNMLAGLPHHYDPAGRYVGPLRTNIAPPKIRLGTDGIPLVEYDGVGYRNNPVTTAQYGLWAYGSGHTNVALRAADWLVAHQHADGRWLYDFDFAEFGWKLDAPWGSAMAQGQAMSLLERAYRATHEIRYLRAAVRALAPLSLPVSRGGLQRCFHGNCARPFFEEYPTAAAPTYVLNGFMFTLIGLYDLASVAPRSSAFQLYRAGRRTLDIALPLYDHDKGALYELGYNAQVAAPTYQAIHVYLLRALNAIQHDPRLTIYADRWLLTL